MINEDKIEAYKLAVKEQCAKLKKGDVELVPNLIDIFVLYVVPALNGTTPGDSFWSKIKDLQNFYWQLVEELAATKEVSAVLSAMGMRNFK